MTLSVHYHSLANKVVFITGGASGIGRAMVKAFVAQGAKVAFIDIDDSAAQSLKNELMDHNIWYRQVDVTDASALQQSLVDACAVLGTVNVLVNNVANDRRQPSEDVTVQDWDQCLQINLNPAFFASQVAMSFMKQQHSGSIINFSSINAIMGQPQMAGYVTAKAGLIGMTKALARDYGEFGIRVNAILPGWVATERQLASWFTAQEQVKWMEAMALKKLVTPEDVANLALFLASDESSMLTGQGIKIDGGRL
ncbi:SDR family oxidoreductase [Pseudoalteromonas sp. MMG010]|uniref:SDR family NAD(P)-dependent oxidoreductase n=1 Tax=Pseudoalteromonas sp. MMG010 TaxID=2822685 RepID=UPI001B3A34E4|nr:SDR family NAD(P)-dependent oxidoreductase [Pseudoalteromonas sp. MMG010]MBQ4832604.1 SDR family oxidoreductase [Pseudoalteromonas sp. MMG010]